MTDKPQRQFDRLRVEAWLRSRGADRLAHPGGTLYDHLCRVATLLGEWGADPGLQAAGLSHACYSTDGFPHALLDLSERSTLVELIGAPAEHLVYLYASCDRTAVYPQLANPEPVPFADRFTGTTRFVDEPELSAFVELTAANELDVLLHNPTLAATEGENLIRLLAPTRHRLSDHAWHSCLESLSPATDTATGTERRP